MERQTRNSRDLQTDKGCHACESNNENYVSDYKKIISVLVYVESLMIIREYQYIHWTSERTYAVLF